VLLGINLLQPLQPAATSFTILALLFHRAAQLLA
jgi:hypothetical protein